MSNSIIIKDLVREAVCRTNTDLKKRSGWDYDITFLHGHPLEIVETLTEYDQSQTYKDKKYPLVALFHDFKESLNPRTGVYADVQLDIIIANFTLPTYKAPDRYQFNFESILYPIYNQLMKSLLSHGLFIGYQVKADKYDRLYWGREGLYGKAGNVFNDHIDAIEIKNLKLSITEKTCNNAIKSNSLSGCRLDT